jgi:SAM-dependent methyltransferase
MGKINFSNIAKKYHEISTVQKSASENLFNLLDIKPEESVLDVGCGTGNLTSKIKAITSGRVIGIDASEGMVEEAVKNYRNIGIEFLAKNIQDISFDEEFDVIFCNSTFQWFKNIGFTLKKLRKALKPGGRIAIQAPATESYCPNFLSAVNGIVTDDEEIGEVFSFFKSPWLFFETAEEFEIFSSGAIAGYLNQDNYSIKIDNDYIERFKNLVNGEIAKQADKNGLVNLIFKRIYLLAFKL